MAKVDGKRPRWFFVPFRVVAITFLLTLLSFALALLLSILGTAVYALVRHIRPDLPFAYQHIALPFAITVGSIALLVSLIVEIRQYFRTRAGWKAASESTAQQNDGAPRIAIPVPHSEDHAYAGRAVVQYEEAVRRAGGQPVRIALDQTPAQALHQIESCDAVLLPGSKADIDPQKYGAQRHEKTADHDAKRDAVDTLLLDDAYRARKPVLGICYGLQTLNVYRSGSLVQHVESKINHAAGRTVPKAHTVEVEPKSRLAAIVASAAQKSPSDDATPIILAVTSSHHQSADAVGEGLRVVARCPDDHIVEAVEGTAPDHFVLAVQWHPERSVDERAELSASANVIFRAFVEAAKEKGRVPSRE
jgi:putative glutamine amidotransferase